MNQRSWRDIPVKQRVHTLRWALPVAIAVVVLIYQLGFAAYAHDQYGHAVHTLLELAFYGVVGPIVSWATLTQIGRWLQQKERAEQAARAHERLLATIVDASADAILSLDAKGIIRSWNQGATSLVGYSADQMIGRRLDELLTPAQKGKAVSQDGPLASWPRHYEAAIRRRDEQMIPVDVTQTPLPDEQGHPGGVSVILRDVRERKAREEVLTEERARISRDLHDGLAQSLYFMGLKLDFIRKQVQRDPDLAEQELSALKQTVQTNIRNVRRTIFALRPVDLEGLGFQTAVEKYVREFGEQTALAIDMQWVGDVGLLPPSLEPQIFRILQESLNNIAKHAEAHSVQVTIALNYGNNVVNPAKVTTREKEAGFLSRNLRPNVVALSVRDDGVGFDSSAVETTGGEGKMGIRQMQERVQALHGSLHLESTPGRGTTLQMTLPLAAFTMGPAGSER